MPSLIALFKTIIAYKKDKAYLSSIKQFTPKTILRSNLYKDKVCFSHIGLLGDIIYAIPCMLALANGKKIELYLDVNQETLYPKNFKHYNKTKILTPNSITFISALILSNPAFTACKILSNQKIDYDLNEFRRYPFDFRMGNISRYYFLAFGTTYNLALPWLKVKSNESYQNEIVIARSFRYQALGISYQFLSNLQNLCFVGLIEEYNAMKIELPNLKYVATKTALDLAEIIAGCKFFIGNQSFPFAIAEALKIKRVLEVSYKTPNVIVEGANGYDFCYQAQFEQIIKDILN